MSFLYKGKDGVTRPVAGLNGLSGDLVMGVSTTRSGTVNLGGTSLDANSWVSQTITFDTPMPDANYIIEINLISTFLKANIVTKRADGFTVEITNSSNSARSVDTLTYTAFKLYTNDDANHLKEQVSNNAEAIGEIAAVIPSNASADNQLVTRLGKNSKTLKVTAGTSSTNMIDLKQLGLAAATNYEIIVTGITDLHIPTIMRGVVCHYTGTSNSSWGWCFSNSITVEGEKLLSMSCSLDGILTISGTTIYGNINIVCKPFINSIPQ